MGKIKLGLVTAWGECGMGYIAKNWVYTFDKYPDKINYQIYSRAYPWLSPFRWHGENIIDGPERMEVDNPHFWNWVNSYKPDVILFQDQNIVWNLSDRKPKAWFTGGRKRNCRDG